MLKAHKNSFRSESKTLFGTVETDGLTSNELKNIEMFSRQNGNKNESTSKEISNSKIIESLENEIEQKNLIINQLRNKIKSNDSASDTESKLNDSLETQKITYSPSNQSANYAERYINDLNKSEVEKEILFNIDLEIIELNQINKSNIANEENSFKNKYYQLMECN